MSLREEIKSLDPKRKDLIDQKLNRDASTYWKPKQYLVSGRIRFEKYF